MVPILVISAADSMELAQMIASALIETGEAACVNIIDGVRSVYRWEGKTCEENELVLLIKTSEDRFEAVRSRIRKLHTYQLPEIIAVPIHAGDPEYLAWLSSSGGR